MSLRTICLMFFARPIHWLTMGRICIRFNRTRQVRSGIAAPLVLVAAAISMAGCSISDGSNAGTVNNDGKGNGVGNRPLAGTTWHIVGTSNFGGAAIKIVPQMNIKFDRNTISAKICNRMNGDYSTLGKSKIRFGNIGGTEMFCNESAMRIEQFFKPGNIVYALEENGLTLTNEAGETLLLKADGSEQ